LDEIQDDDWHCRCSMIDCGHDLFLWTRKTIASWFN
jgi:hypothetical protein